MQSAGVEMTFLSDVVSVAFVSDLITWSTRDSILSQLTDPAMGVYLCGAPLPEHHLVTGHVQFASPLCSHICLCHMPTVLDLLQATHAAAKCQS